MICGSGGGTQGQGKDMSTMQKRGHLMEVSQRFVPHCRAYVKHKSQLVVTYHLQLA